MWQDRVVEGALNDPDNVRTSFMFEDVSQILDKKGAAYEYTGAQGRRVDNRGVNGRIFPIIAYFSGADHDLAADGFLTSVSKPGLSRLEHPFYGIVTVAPFGRVTRRDDLKTAANQSVIQLEFWESLVEDFPQATTTTTAAVNLAISDTVATQATIFAAAVPQATSSGLVRIVERVNDFNGLIRSALTDTADTLNTVESQVAATVTALVADPVSLVLDSVRLAQRPLTSIGRTVDRVAGYVRLLETVTSRDAATAAEFDVLDSYGTVFVLSAAQFAASGEYASQTEALEQAFAVTAALNTWTDWRDGQFDALGEVDANANYSNVQSAAILAAQATVALAFTLQLEINITLDRPRTIIDLVGELYGSIDDRLDLFITSNDLSGDEIRTLPRGRAIVYYR